MARPTLVEASREAARRYTGPHELDRLRRRAFVQGVSWDQGESLADMLNPDGTITAGPLAALREEVIRAATKYPGNEDRVLAMAGEITELLSAILHAKAAGDEEQMRVEALQVAACAMRLHIEGDASMALEDKR